MDSYKLYFLVAFGIIDVFFLIYVYLRVIRPTRAVEMGMDLLRQQDFNSRLRHVGYKRTDSLVELFNEMLDRIKNEHLKLEEQNYLMDQLIRVSPMGVILCDFDSVILQANASALRFLEAKDAIVGKTIAQIQTPLAQKIANLQRGQVETVRMSDAKIYRCQILSFVDHGFARPFILIESLTEEVMEAEKRAYEKVIRMIAHEVNNTVAGVGSILQSMDEDELMSVCNHRLSHLSQFITRFADVVKIPEPTLLPCDLNKVIQGCAHFLESLCCQQGIAFQVHYAKAPVLLHLDAALMEQVLVNITKNAIESIIPDQASPAVTLTITSTYMEITDNGAGISDQVADRLFTPFFSTKPTGQGIGLLFIREVLRKHHFTFALYTSPTDHLTHFKITF